jgi:hypothetical protein
LLAFLQEELAGNVEPLNDEQRTIHNVYQTRIK